MREEEEVEVQTWAQSESSERRASCCPVFLTDYSLMKRERSFLPKSNAETELDCDRAGTPRCLRWRLLIGETTGFIKTWVICFFARGGRNWIKNNHSEINWLCGWCLPPEWKMRRHLCCDALAKDLFRPKAVFISSAQCHNSLVFIRRCTVKGVFRSLIPITTVVKYSASMMSDSLMNWCCDTAQVCVWMYTVKCFGYHSRYSKALWTKHGVNYHRVILSRPY